MHKLVIFDWEGTLADTRKLWLAEPDASGHADALQSASVLPTEPYFFYSGILAQLKTLQKLGFLLAVATGKSTRDLAECLSHPALQGLFACTRTAEQTAPKPQPLMLQEIMLELHISPRHSVMIGDSPDDIRMARAAGCRAIAVNWDSERSLGWLDYQPDAVLHAVSQLASALQDV